ncbi:MAG: S1 RNA-binding domain-containing protein [Candidatus Aminicenantes bacterium]|nr:S1 RNA-binding domain-containing protein [Candidatus Aminicenantes bacterium]
MSSEIKTIGSNPPNKSEDQDSFEDMLAESFKSTTGIKINIGDKVDATVAAIDKDNVFVEMGPRIEGFVNRAEFIEDGELTVKEGQAIQVYVAGKSQGMFQCKRYLGSVGSELSGGRDESILIALQDAYENSSPVEGKVKEAAKSGFEVNVMGQKSFCPISQIDKNYCDNPAVHVNKTYTFKIIEFAEEGKNIVLSRKEILLEEDDKKAEKMWQKLEEGKVYDGWVTAVKKYGAFVDIGGIDGLLHVSEISYGRIEDAQNVLKVGQDLKVEIISIDRDRRKVGFSLKSQLEDPWIQGIKELSVGKEVMGKVIRLKPYGAFIEVLPGVDGLLHISQLSGDKRHDHPKEVVKPGDMVKIWIREIDEKKKNISLTMVEPERDIGKDLRELKEEQDRQVEESGGQFADQLDSTREEPVEE